MNSKTANPYLKTQIMTASPEELRLMLYEGAIRFGVQAREALAAGQIETAYNCLMRTQKIVLELSTSLNHQLEPELCAKLSALYTYIYRRLVEANLQHDIKPVEEAIQLLEYEKETWRMLMKQTPAKGGQAPAGGNVANAQQTAISSLTLNG